MTADTTVDDLQIDAAGWGDKDTVKLDGQIIGYIQRWPSGQSVRYEPLRPNLLPIGDTRHRTRRGAAADVLHAHRTREARKQRRRTRT